VPDEEIAASLDGELTEPVAVVNTVLASLSELDSAEDGLSLLVPVLLLEAESAPAEADLPPAKLLVSVPASVTESVVELALALELEPRLLLFGGTAAVIVGLESRPALVEVLVRLECEWWVIPLVLIVDSPSVSAGPEEDSAGLSVRVPCVVRVSP
jgi:hypothetical protein